MSNLTINKIKAAVPFGSKPKFFDFHQNNSGGTHKEPALFVIVEAMDAEDANRRAEAFGLYFNGCEKGRDCSCCGDRWDEQWNDEGAEKPSIYGTPLEEVEKSNIEMNRDWAERAKIPYALIVYMDGSVEEVNPA